MLENFEIDLKAIEKDDKSFSYSLEDSFFTDLEAQDITGGLVDAQVLVKKKVASYELHLHVNGNITIPCDRCLDNMNQPINADSVLKVKFGPSYLDEGDDLIVVPEDEGRINVAWFLYEMIVLSIPIHHAHNDGECNAEMMKLLREHSDQNFNNDDSAVITDNKIDPRWSNLKNLLNNN